MSVAPWLPRINRKYGYSTTIAPKSSLGQWFAVSETHHARCLPFQDEALAHHLLAGKTCWPKKTASHLGPPRSAHRTAFPASVWHHLQHMTITTIDDSTVGGLKLALEILYTEQMNKEYHSLRPAFPAFPSWRNLFPAQTALVLRPRRSFQKAHKIRLLRPHQDQGQEPQSPAPSPVGRLLDPLSENIK